VSTPSSAAAALSPLSPGLSVAQRLVLLGASCGGLGYLPLAPGTWGSLAALPLWWAMASWPWGQQLAAVTLLTALSIWISGRAEALYRSHDVQHIVLDEVAGMLTCALGVPFVGPQIAVAFVAFRVLDAGKPWPICWVDRQVPGGAGVVLDDTLAGLIGCAAMHGAAWLLGGWW
jgi:phosphatidylglycerophosphatase A